MVKTNDVSQLVLLITVYNSRVFKQLPDFSALEESQACRRMRPQQQPGKANGVLQRVYAVYVRPRAKKEYNQHFTFRSLVADCHLSVMVTESHGGGGANPTWP